MRTGICTLLAVISITVGCVEAVAADKAGIPKLSTFSTQARVEIGADGAILAVTPDPALLPAIGDAVRSSVSAWRFVAPIKDGHAVGGVTFVQIAGCAVPVGDGLRMAFDYLGNGPSRVLSVPVYPVSMVRNGESAAVTLTYRVEPDGSAVVEELQMVSGKASAAKKLRPALQSWLDGSKFVPEQVAGQAVATRMSMPIEFIAPMKTFTSTQAALRDMQAQLQARAADSDVCKMALQNDAPGAAREIALDSPFKWLPPG